MWGVFQSLPGRSFRLQGPPTLQGAPGAFGRDGQAGLGHLPWRGGWGCQAEACLQGGVEGVFAGSERPEAGYFGEYGL